MCLHLLSSFGFVKTAALVLATRHPSSARGCRESGSDSPKNVLSNYMRRAIFYICDFDNSMINILLFVPEAVRGSGNKPSLEPES